MAHNHSFTEYVAKQSYNELYGAIDNYLQENKDDLDLRLYRVNNIDTITLVDITVKFIDVSDLPGMAIEFDVAIEVLCGGLNDAPSVRLFHADSSLLQPRSSL